MIRRLVLLTTLTGCLSSPQPAEVSDAAPPSDSTAVPDTRPGIDSQPTTIDAAIADAVPTVNSHSIGLIPSNDHYLRTGDNPAGLNALTGFTIEVWIKLASLPDIDARFSIVGKVDDGANNSSYRLEFANQGGLYRVTARAEGTFEGANARQLAGWNWSTPDTGMWRHLAVTYDLNQSPRLARFRFYLDGVERTTILDLGGGADIIDSIRLSTSPVTVGAWLNGGQAQNRLDGQIDELRIWDVVRSPTEIAAAMSTELTGTESGLIGYWQFDDALTDATTNGNTLVVVGTPVPAFVAETPF